MATTCSHCAKHSHSSQGLIGVGPAQSFYTPPAKKYKSRFKVGQVIRFHGSPSGLGGTSPNYPALVEFVGDPGPQQDLHVRLASGSHTRDLAERFKPIHFGSLRVWAKACARYGKDLSCFEHGVVPGASERFPVIDGQSFEASDTRSEGAKRYDAEQATKTPAWARLGYTSQEEMDYALT